MIQTKSTANWIKLIKIEAILKFAWRAHLPRMKALNELSRTILAIFKLAYELKKTWK